jgi:DUF917 family protein
MVTAGRLVSFIKKITRKSGNFSNQRKRGTNVSIATLEGLERTDRNFTVVFQNCFANAPKNGAVPVNDSRLQRGL